MNDNNQPVEQDLQAADEGAVSKKRSALRRAWDALDRPIDALRKRLAESPFCREYGYLILCLLIPAFLVYLMYLTRLLHPFGDGCVLVLDLNGQYVWFFEALRNFVRGDADLLYSFSRALGGEFLGIYAYYLASPLSFLLCLFPQNMMLEGLLFLFMLKASLCGLTFGIYMHKTLRERRPFAVIAFSIFYALTAYAVIQQHNTMWIDAVMWLPMITLGIESLIKHGKYKLYTISLAVAVFSNFYIGYMICFYCVIYFVLYYLAHREQDRNPLAESAHLFKSLLRIAFFSVIALGIAAVIIFGAYYALNFGKTTFTDPSWEWKQKFNLYELLFKFLPGSYDTVRPEGLPCLYCGVPTLLLLPIYFQSKRYSLRQKLCSLAFIAIFLFSMIFTVPDLIWHGFQNPNWLNYRYSFMLCFYLCVLACRSFAEIDGARLGGVFGMGTVILVMAGLCTWYTDGEYVKPDWLTSVLFTIAATLVYLTVLTVYKRKTCKRLACLFLIAAVCSEAYLCGLWNLNDLDEDVGYSRYSYYNSFLNSTRPIVEAVQESDDGFYRMEKTLFRKVNDNMALGMRGLSGSTSTLNYETVRFLNKMGYASSSHWSKYLGGTPVSDSLLGIKYLVSDNPTYANFYEIYRTDEKNGLTAYKNPYALSIAYGVDDSVLDFPLGYLDPEKDNSGSVMATGDNTDGTAEKDGIAALIAALKAKLNETLGIEETVNRAEYVDEYDSPMVRLNEMVSAMLGEEETLKLFSPITRHIDFQNVDPNYAVGHYAYYPIDAAKDAIISYTVTVPVDSEIFYYEPSDYPREVALSLREGKETTDLGTFNGHETSRIISLGWHEAGTRLTLDIKITEGAYYPMLDQSCIFYLNKPVFESAMARLGAAQYQIESYTEHSFNGTLTTSRKDELVLTTIAYDSGWKVFVDGEEVEITKALGSLVAFRIEGDAGETHRVQLRYDPPVIRVGLAISLVSLGLLALIIFTERFIKKIPVLRTIVGIYPQNAEKSASNPQ